MERGCPARYEEGGFGSQERGFGIQIGNPPALLCMEQFAQQFSGDQAMTPRHFAAFLFINQQLSDKACLAPAGAARKRHWRSALQDASRARLAAGAM
jgi:hypothetical protein